MLALISYLPAIINQFSLAGSVMGCVMTGTWDDGNIGGSFDDENLLDATYTPPMDYDGDITLTLTSADPDGPCPSVTDAVTLTVHPDILLLTEFTQPKCFGNANGTATVNITQGTGPFTYIWRNSMNTIISMDPTATGLVAGTYTIEVIGADDCFSIETVVVTQPEQLDAEESANLICYGTSTGSISLFVTGGTPPYLFDWNYDGTGDFDDPQNPSGLPAGTYVGVVLDDNFCTTEVTAVISETVEIVITDISTTIATCGMSDGAIDITVTGGFLGLTYEWFDESDDLISTDQDLTGLAAGTYRVVITDSHPDGCSY